MVRRTTLLGLLCVSTAVGCDVFDEKLEARIDSVKPAPDAGNPDAGNPGKPDAAVDAGAPLFDLGQCNRAKPAPVVQGSATPLTISVAGHTNTVRETGCNIGDALSGADGYFEIQANAGERWHFHLDAAEGQDLAIMALSGCEDTRNCEASANVCGKGQSEHFTFVADNAGTYAVVIEGIDAKLSEPLSLLAIRPTCGNNIKEHSEVCDFGDVTPGDGCDATCRVELLSNNAQEVEPNDDSYGANVVLPPNDDPVRILGSIAGPACQPDYYLVRTEEKRVLTIDLLGANGKACKGAPPVDIAVSKAKASQLQVDSPVESATSSDGTCPKLEPLTLDKGAYFIRVRHLKTADLFDYRLDLTWSDVPVVP